MTKLLFDQNSLQIRGLEHALAPSPARAPVVGTMGQRGLVPVDDAVLTFSQVCAHGRPSWRTDGAGERVGAVVTWIYDYAPPRAVLLTHRDFLHDARGIVLDIDVDTSSGPLRRQVPIEFWQEPMVAVSSCPYAMISLGYVYEELVEAGQTPCWATFTEDAMISASHLDRLLAGDRRGLCARAEESIEPWDRVRLIDFEVEFTFLEGSYEDDGDYE